MVAKNEQQFDNFHAQNKEKLSNFHKPQNPKKIKTIKISMNIQPLYKFPVQDGFDVRDVTELDFDIVPFFDELYINLDSIRGTQYRDDLDFQLNIRNNQLTQRTRSYTKIVFSGHKGSGKTIELGKYHKEINHPDRYFSIFIQLENETNLARFEPEDLFVMLIAKLIERCKKDRISIKDDYLDNIAEEWIQDVDLKTEVTDVFKHELNAKAGFGFKFFDFFNVGTGFKTVFGGESKTAKIIRRKVKQNTLGLIAQFNEILEELREELQTRHGYKDILFIMDGSEKIKQETYQYLFIENNHLIRNLNANCIFAIPINFFFAINASLAAGFFERSILPMIKVNEQSKKRLAEILTKRIDPKFFGDQVLDKIAEQSGGSVRQLLGITNRAIMDARGETITLQSLQQSLKLYGSFLNERLNTEETQILKDFYQQKIELKPADEITGRLLFSLALLKYNGHYKVNPILLPFINVTS